MGLNDDKKNTAGEPEVISTAKELTAFLKETVSHIQPDEGQSDILLGYFEGHDYTLGFMDGQLYRGDLCYAKDKIKWEPYSIDDVVDTVCEWNYELISEEEERIEGRPAGVHRSESEEKLDRLRKDENVLDALFDLTKYAKQINVIAESFAQKLISAVQNSDNIDKVVTAVCEDIRSYSTGGRSR